MLRAPTRPFLLVCLYYTYKKKIVFILLRTSITARDSNITVTLINAED